MRNVGIVFSPTLGIPAGVFSLMLAEFNRVFNVDGDAIAESAVDEKGNTVLRADENGDTEISHRNSKHYLDATTDQLLGLSGRQLTGSDEDAPSEDGEELSENTESGTDTTDQDVPVESLPGNRQSSPQTQPSPEQTPPSRSRVSNLAAARGLGIHVTNTLDASRHGQAGLPTSPRPLGRSPPSAVLPQEGLTLGSSAPSQQR